jgi:hypothetical protein
MPIPTTGFISKTFTSNQDTDLINIFPVTQFHITEFTGNENNGNRSFKFDLKPSYGTTNYAVFTSIYYGYTGSSSGTYTVYGTSSTMGQIVISERTETGFKVNFSSGTGDNLNIKLVCMVVFNDNLNY